MADDDVQVLQAHVRRLLADALRTAEDTSAATERVQRAHDAARAEAEQRHEAQLAAQQRAFDDRASATDHAHGIEVGQLRAALASRDVIGQAKGILMATMGCTPEEAFDLLVKQSQAENRKLAELAAELAAHAVRPGRRPTPRAAG